MGWFKQTHVGGRAVICRSGAGPSPGLPGSSICFPVMLRKGPAYTLSPEQKPTQEILLQHLSSAWLPGTPTGSTWPWVAGGLQNQPCKKFRSLHAAGLSSTGSSALSFPQCRPKTPCFWLCWALCLVYLLLTPQDGASTGKGGAGTHAGGGIILSFPQTI